jgi:hypothetical protein
MVYDEYSCYYLHVEDESLPDSQLNYHDINIDVAPDSALATASATEEAEEVIDSAG